MPIGPTATLIALTEDARAALGGKADVRFRQFPYKVGRESRTSSLARLRTEMERRLSGASQLNDLYLLEPASSTLMHISREHFLIDWIDGRFVIVDRESACGTTVDGMALGGGGSTLTADLHDGDSIVVGGEDSPFAFRFRSAPGD